MRESYWMRDRKRGKEREIDLVYVWVWVMAKKSCEHRFYMLGGRIIWM